MEKKPFVTKEQLEEIAKTYPTPFYLYDEKGIRENAMKLKEAFSWNKGFREYFAVKATPNPVSYTHLEVICLEVAVVETVKQEIHEIRHYRLSALGL